MTDKVKECIQTVEIERFKPHQDATNNVIQHQYASTGPLPVASNNVIQHQYAGTVTIDQVIGIVNSTKELSEQFKEVTLEVLEKHSGDKFNGLQDLLGIGFPPEVVEVLQICNELIQLFA